MREIERRCLEWRWRLKAKTQRLRQVHGDFHPWNILFRAGADFSGALAGIVAMIPSRIWRERSRNHPTPLAAPAGRRP